MEEWRKFYCQPEVPEETTDSSRNFLRYPSDEEWEEHKKEENRMMLQFHNWEESRRQAEKKPTH